MHMQRCIIKCVHFFKNMHRKAMIQCLYSIKNLILPKQLESTHILNCIRFRNFWHWIDNSFLFSLTLSSQFIYFFPSYVVIPQNQRIQVKKYWIVWKCTHARVNLFFVCFLFVVFFPSLLFMYEIYCSKNLNRGTEEW